MKSSKQKSTSLPKEVSWEGPSHQNHYRSPAWYIIFLIASVAAVGFAIFYERSITTVITFALIILVILFSASQPQRTVKYKISAAGLSVNRTLYSFAIIKKFWIDYHPPDIKALNFETSAYLNNKVSFQLGDADPLLIRLVTKQYLPEDLQHADGLRETLAKKLKI